MSQSQAAVPTDLGRFPLRPGTHLLISMMTPNSLGWICHRISTVFDWSRISIDPQSNNAFHDTHANIVIEDIEPLSRVLRKGQNIKINSSWADALNIRPEGTIKTLIETLITPNEKPLGPIPFAQFPISYVLGPYIVDSIARVHADATPWLQSCKVISGNSDNFSCIMMVCHQGWFDCGRGKEEEVASANYTRVSFHAERYLYGWGFRGTVIKLANIALLLHAALCLVYGIWSVWNGHSFSLAGSIGEMIALAMNSNASEKLRGTCAVIRSLGTWEKNVVLQKTNEHHIEFIFEDDSDDEPRSRPICANTRYG